MNTATAKQDPKPKSRKPAFVAARLHTEIAALQARVARNEQALTDSRGELTAKLKELDAADPETKAIARRMLGVGEKVE